MIPARNKHLVGSSPDARSVISHYTEKYSVVTNNMIDNDYTNTYADDPALYPPDYIPSVTDGATEDKYGHKGDYSPRGGELNVWLSRKPYVGQNASIYVMLLDDAGEMSGAPLEINLACNPENYGNDGSHYAYLSKWHALDRFIAFGNDGNPIPRREFIDGERGFGTAINDAGVNAYFAVRNDPKSIYASGEFDDNVAHYVTLESAKRYWVTGWGDINAYVRIITAPNYGAAWGDVADFGTGTVAYEMVADGKESDTTVAPAEGTETTLGFYSYLLAPSGGIAQPRGYKEGTQFVYKVNVPSILYQDIVLLDYYVEYEHNATQVSILPDKFGPYLYVEGSSLVRRASDGMDLPVEFVIPKFKVTTALTFTLTGTGDASTFTFSGDAYPDFSKFDLTRKVLADIQILDADDNYDGATGEAATADPTSYRRYKYNDDTDGEYLWKDPSLEPHQNLDFSDAQDYNHGKGRRAAGSDGAYTEDNNTYGDTYGGPATRTPGRGLIDTLNNEQLDDAGNLNQDTSDAGRTKHLPAAGGAGGGTGGAGGGTGGTP